jgi:hypothetical protein
MFGWSAEALDIRWYTSKLLRRKPFTSTLYCEEVIHCLLNLGRRGSLETAKAARTA